MRVRRWSAVAALAGMAGAAAGQNEVIYEVDKALTAYRADLSTAPSLAVGKLQIVVAGHHRLQLFDKSVAIDPTSSSSLLDARNWGPYDYDVTFPPQYPDPFPFTPHREYIPALPDIIPGLIFPTADYDPITENVWMMYSEAGDNEVDDPPDFKPARPEFGGAPCIIRLHLAASKTPTFNDFSNSDWTYITGRSSTGTQGNGGQAIFLDSVLTPFRPGSGTEPSPHSPFKSNPTYLSFGFDTNDVFIAAMDPGSCDEEDEDFGQTILIMPRKFGVPETDVHAGGRPDEIDFTIIRMTQPPLIEDNCFQMLAVQEPYEQYENVTLFISTNGAVHDGTNINSIRLRGVFWNDKGTPTTTDDEWEVRQSLKETSPGNFALQDTLIPTAFDDLRAVYGDPPTYYPEAPNSFDPSVEDEAFATAVLTEDNQGNERVFAVHAAIDIDGHWAVQWYVIDPKIVDNSVSPPYLVFHQAPILSDEWQPEIVAMGRIKTDGAAQPNTGDCYHPVLGVTRSGQVFIEYTFSDATTNQRILRAQLGNTYTTVAATSVLQVGPSTAYAGDLDRWALYGDMQTDPTECKLWSTHTLVEDAATREVWLFEKGFTCFTTNLNADEGTDPYDMLIYNDLFLRGLRRADTDADDVIDATDMATFIDAYDAATGP